MSARIVVRRDGLLNYLDLDGVQHEGLADDELVRLSAKQARRHAAEAALRSIHTARLTQPPPNREAEKCRRCASREPKIVRPMMGTPVRCHDNFHDRQSGT